MYSLPNDQSPNDRSPGIELISTIPSMRELGRGGFEPPKAEPADLQSAPFDRFGTYPKKVNP